MGIRRGCCCGGQMSWVPYCNWLPPVSMQPALLMQQPMLMQTAKSEQAHFSCKAERELFEHVVICIMR